MRIENVVVDASPLICLFKSGLSDILPVLFTEIIVPDKVYQEISVKNETVPVFSNKQFKPVSSISIPVSIMSWDLGEGESSVLSYSLGNPDYWAIY